MERSISPRVDGSPVVLSASPPYLLRPPEPQQLTPATGGGGVGDGGSPFTATTEQGFLGIAQFNHPGDPSTIHRNLLLELSGILGNSNPSSKPSPASIDIDADLDAILDQVLRIMHKCIDVFAQYFFPNTPIAHVPSLRRAASDFGSAFGVSPFLLGDASGDQVFSMRNFTLITALCAFITSVVPGMAAPHSISLTWPFYYASRAMARLYEELDLEAPVSSSYTSRIWQSAALQNMTGKNLVAWHVAGEVTIMAIRERLYDEKTVGRNASLESQLLRANFWLIYLSDRTATAFEGRPSVMSDILSQGLLTLHERGPSGEPLLETANSLNGDSVEDLLTQGFHLKTRLWASAADVMLHLKAVANPGQTMAPMRSLPESPDWIKLVELHQAFLAVLDDLPTCLRSPNGVIMDTTSGDPIGTYQAQSFWALRNNIFSVYHSMRLIMLHECILQGIPEVLGLENKAESLAMRKLEIVQDFLLEMQLAPFLCLKVQGEAAVSFYSYERSGMQ